MKEKVNNKITNLFSLEDFKALAGIDDREERLASFCLVTATLAIEQYCKRHLRRKKHLETVEFYGDKNVPLSEYPVNSILTAYAVSSNPRRNKKPGELIEPDFYFQFPNEGIVLDIPYYLSLSPALLRYRGLEAIKVIYSAGYPPSNIPADLAAACFELASWNLSRYKGRRIGMTGNVRSSGKDGEHFELSMPEQVKQLLEPYKRKTL